MAARDMPNPARILQEVHVGLTRTELDQLRHLAAKHHLPMTRLVRAKLRVPTDYLAVQRIYGEHVASLLAWHLTPSDGEGPLTVYVGRPRR